ncbi:MAG: hypothetical protein ACRDNS_29880, partial [Trebonia sp.]
FVVITNAQGIRYTHPTPALIGTPITYGDPEPVTSESFRTGRDWLGPRRARSAGSRPARRRCA